MYYSYSCVNIPSTKRGEDSSFVVLFLVSDRGCSVRCREEGRLFYRRQPPWWMRLFVLCWCWWWHERMSVNDAKLKIGTIGERHRITYDKKVPTGTSNHMYRCTMYCMYLCMHVCMDVGGAQTRGGAGFSSSWWLIHEGLALQNKQESGFDTASKVNILPSPSWCP